MKPLCGRVLPATCVVISFLASAASAQEYFREFGTSRSSGGIGRLTPSVDVFEGNDPSGLSPIAPVNDLETEEDYNFRLGNLDFIVAAGLGVEFNDNINLSENDRQSDIIFRPTLDIEGMWRFSETSRLRFGVGISYAKYLDHDEYDSESVLVAPNSAIAWTFKSGAFTVTLRERLSYQEDPFDLPLASGVARYGRWENQAGIQVDWQVNEPTRITFGYDRYDLWARDVAFQNQDRSVDTVYLRPSYQIAPTLSLGLNTSLSWVDFKENVQADSVVWMVGPYVLWNVTDTFDVYAEIGYQQSTFSGGTLPYDPVTGEAIGDVPIDSSDGSSMYGKIELSHRPTENFRHKLFASKTTEVGYGSNYYDLYHVEYTADWKLAENTSLTSSLFYEHYETSGDIGDKAHRVGAAIGLNRILSDHFSVGLDYRFLLKNSQLPDSDYYQNLAMLSLYYKF